MKTYGKYISLLVLNYLGSPESWQQEKEGLAMMTHPCFDSHTLCISRWLDS